MVIRRNGPFDDMALDDMVLDEVSCSQFDIWIIASIRSPHLDSDLRGRDKKSTLNLFKYIFIEHDIVILAPTYKI